MSIPFRYKGPGKYFAVCNKTNFDGHYIMPFEIPDTAEWQEVDAAWYFLNVVSFEACVEAVYLAEIFEKNMQVRTLAQVEADQDEETIRQFEKSLG